MPDTHPLPPRPSLEYARKAAKTLLRRLHAGDPDALDRARTRHPQIAHRDPGSLRLADAQLVVAREHGFASWQRLVRYMGDVERQQHSHHQLHWGPEVYEREARGLIAAHAKRRVLTGRALAASVPRLYGLSLEEVFATTISEDEARLAVARRNGAPSWAVFIERLEGNARTKPGTWESDTMRRAFEAMVAADLGALQQAVADSPELLHPSEFDLSSGRTLMGLALGQERKQGAAALRPIIAWLETQGLSRQLELNRRLCGHGIGLGRAEEVRSLIRQGADPNWLPPNGIPVLEHALLTYRSGEAVDVLAEHVKPRNALWISAGLGDVNGVRQSLDDRGRPTPAARRIRPDWVAVGQGGLGPSLPDPDDEEILLEALVVAILNGRGAVIEYLVSRGAPVNSLVFGTPILMVAINTPEMAECLVRCGADLDLSSEDSNGTPRELVRNLFEQAPDDPWRRRLVAACGMNAEALLAEINARPPLSPVSHPTLRKALSLANEDAVRLRQPDVRPENLLIGLMRAGGPPFYRVKEGARIDIERFHAELADRLTPADGESAAAELPLHADARAAMDAAFSLATEKRHEAVYGTHLLHALTRCEEDPAGQLLARFGGDVAKLHAGLEEWLL